MQFAQNLKNIMDIKKITNYRLAKMLGVHQTTIKNWLDGKTTPSPQKIQAIAQALETSVNQLVSQDILTFGQRLRAIRKSKKMTQKELAKKLGIATNSLSRYETGERNPSISMLKEIAKALEVPQYELMDDEFKQSVPDESQKLNYIHINFPTEGGYEIAINGKRYEHVSELNLNFTPTGVTLRITHDVFYECTGDCEKGNINLVLKGVERCQE